MSLRRLPLAPALRTVIFGFLLAERPKPGSISSTRCQRDQGGAGQPNAERGEALSLPKWNPNAQKLEADKGKKGLTAEDVMATLKELGKLCRGDVITKFNATTKESEDNDKAVFVVEVSLRSRTQPKRRNC